MTPFRPSRILVTGANGYLGSRVVERCAALSDVHVDAVWHARDDSLARNANVQHHRCDLADRDAVARLFAAARVDAVIHTAALLPDGGPQYLSRAVTANVLGTAHLGECAAAAGVRRFVYCSSISVYGATPRPEAGWTEESVAAPVSPYGWSKFVGEECVRLACADSGLTGLSLRLAGIHGGPRRSGVLYQFMMAAAANKPLTVNDAGAPFQILFLGDAVDALWSAVSAPVDTPYVRINVASHVAPSMRRLAEDVVAAAGSPSTINDGAPGDGVGHVMNTDLMARLLRTRPEPLESRLRDLREALARLSAQA